MTNTKEGSSSDWLISDRLLIYETFPEENNNNKKNAKVLQGQFLKHVFCIGKNWLPFSLVMEYFLNNFLI